MQEGSDEELDLCEELCDDSDDEEVGFVPVGDKLMETDSVWCCEFFSVEWITWVFKLVSRSVSLTICM